MNGEIDTGRIVAQTFRVAFSDIATYYALGLLTLLPVLVLGLIPVLTPVSPALSQAMSLVATLLQAILGQVATAAIAYGVFRRLSGGRASLVESLSMALRRFVPVVLVSIMVGLVVGIGTLLFIIPGLIAMTVLFVAIPATIVEDPGVLEAMSRSGFLTSGNRMRIFFIALFFGVLNFFIGLVAALVADTNPVLQQLLTLGLMILSTVLQATAATLVYYRLREIKEDLAVDRIAEIFA